MSTKDLVMRIEKPHFVVKLHTNLLEIDLKEGIKKELEDAVEKKSALRESFGVLFQTIVPLDVPLKDIDSVHVDDSGQLKITIPMRRDLIIPSLTEKESKKLMEKLNELIPIEKDAELRRRRASRKTRAQRRTIEAREERRFEARRQYG